MRVREYIHLLENKKIQLIIGLLLILIAVNISKAYTLDGYVTSDNNSVEDVYVLYNGSSTYTNVDGYYSFSVNNSSGTIKMSANGYKTHSAIVLVNNDTVHNATLIQNSVVEQLNNTNTLLYIIAFTQVVIVVLSLSRIVIR